MPPRPVLGVLARLLGEGYACLGGRPFTAQLKYDGQCAKAQLYPFEARIFFGGIHLLGCMNISLYGFMRHSVALPEAPLSARALVLQSGGVAPSCRPIGSETPVLASNRVSIHGI